MADPVHEPADEHRGHADGQRLGGEDRPDLAVVVVLVAHQKHDRQRQRSERQPPDQGEHHYPGDARCAQHVEIAAEFTGHIDCRAVPVKTDSIGKSYPPFEYELGKEKIARVRPCGG